MTTGTVTITETTHKPQKKIKVAWTATAGGAAAETTTQFYTGVVKACVTDPDGVSVPSSYGLVITDAEGLDVLAGQGSGRSATVVEYITSGCLPIVATQLTFTISGAGSGGKGVAWLYVSGA